MAIDRVIMGGTGPNPPKDGPSNNDAPKKPAPAPLPDVQIKTQSPDDNRTEEQKSLAWFDACAAYPEIELFKILIKSLTERVNKIPSADGKFLKVGYRALEHDLSGGKVFDWGFKGGEVTIGYLPSDRNIELELPSGIGLIHGARPLISFVFGTAKNNFEGMRVPTTLSILDDGDGKFTIPGKNETEQLYITVFRDEIVRDGETESLPAGFAFASLKAGIKVMFNLRSQFPEELLKLKGQTKGLEFKNYHAKSEDELVNHLEIWCMRTLDDERKAVARASFDGYRQYVYNSRGFLSKVGYNLARMWHKRSPSAP